MADRCFDFYPGSRDGYSDGARRSWNGGSGNYRWKRWCRRGRGRYGYQGCEVFTLIEVVLVDAGGATQTVRTQDQIERLKDCGFPRVVIPNENAMRGEIECGIFNASEILDSQAADLQYSPRRCSASPKKPPIWRQTHSTERSSDYEFISNSRAEVLRFPYRVVGIMMMMRS